MSDELEEFDEDKEEKKEEKKEENRDAEGCLMTDVEEGLMRHWRFLYAANPDWFKAERLKLELRAVVEQVDPALSLVLPELFNAKRKREEDEEGSYNIPIVSFQTESKVKVLRTVGEVLRPRKFETEWRRKFQEREMKKKKQNEKNKVRSVFKNKEKRKLFGVNNINSVI